MDIDLAASASEAADMDMSDAMQIESAGSGDYNAQLAAITALRERDPRSDELRRVRETMAAQFPLSPDIWEDWIDDEASDAPNAPRRRYILDLCARAVQDYLAPKLYARYISLAVEYEEGNEGEVILTRDDVRNVCQRANAACQWIIPESHLVWDLYRDYEIELLETATTAEAQQSQIARIRTLYKDRLRIPHRTIEDTFSYYSSFETARDNTNYESHLVAMMPHYNRGKAELAEREAAEQALVATGYSDESLLAYVHLEEQKSKDLQRIRCIFERVATVRCLDPGLWDYYIVYLLSKSQLVDVAGNVAERALRNCPWSAALWGHRMRILEKREAADHEIETVYLQGLSNDLILTNPTELSKLMLAKLEWLNRSLTSTDENSVSRFRDAALECRQMFNDLHPTGDPSEALARFCLSIEQRRIRDKDEVRRQWEPLMKKHGNEAQFWLEYVHSEREMGELNKCRSLFKQAVSRNLDWPEVVFEAWIAFERENGDLLTTYTALERVEGRRKQLAVQLQKADTVVATAAYDAIYTNAGAPAAPNLEMEIDATKVAQESSKKRKKGSNGVVARKKPKPEPTTEDATIESTQGIESAKEEPMTVDDDTARTVYVSKLPLDIADARIRPLFEPFGKIRDVRIIRRDTTAFAYVEFEDAAAAKACCALNGQPFEGGKAIKVAISNPSQKTANVPPPERKELFVRNFPRSFSEDDIRNVFAAFGEVTAVRILRFDDGQSRGIAFVEFGDEEAAAAAVSLHDTDVGGRPLLVEHSDPNARKKQGKGPSASGGRGRGGFGPGGGRPPIAGEAGDQDRPSYASRGAKLGLGAGGRGRGRRMGLGGASGKKAEAESQQSQPSSAPRSNDDFRKMFIKGDNL